MTPGTPRLPASRRRQRTPVRRVRRLETWCWTGPLGHLVGGSLDFGRALALYLLARARGRRVR